MTLTPQRKAEIRQAWNAASQEERDRVRKLALEKYFASATAADIVDRIPAPRRAAVLREFIAAAQSDRPESDADGLQAPKP